MDDKRLGYRDRSAYLWVLVCRPESIRELARQTGMSRGQATAACRRLDQFKWFRLEEVGKAQPRQRPVPLVPIECQLALARELEREYELVPKKGEFLMKRHLDMWVCSRRFVDNARPDFLTNPKTGVPLEYDRYYFEEHVAFEFNGPQHYGTTSEFADDEAVKDQQARDAMKQGLSVRAGVKLITVTPGDLRQGQFEKLLPAGIALNPVDTSGPYYQTLIRISTAYAAKTARQAPAASGVGGKK